MSRSRKGKREYLNDIETKRKMKDLDQHFESKVEILLIRQGKKPRIEKLINEEARVLAKYLRDERKTWIPKASLARGKYYKDLDGARDDLLVKATKSEDIRRAKKGWQARNHQDRT